MFNKFNVIIILMKQILILILPLLFSGCLYVNDRGIDNNYYNQCREYYDSMGVYHKTCDKNIVEFQKVKDGTKRVIKKVKDTTKTIIKNTQEYVNQ
jgi:hypothetical protein